MAKLLKKRDTAASNIVRYLNISSRLKKESITRELVSTRITRLKEYFSEYEDLQNQMEETCGESELPYQIIERENSDEAYVNALANFETILNSFDIPKKSSTSDIVEQHERHIIKLPTINLPNFSGNYQDWPSFENLFKSLIHQNTKLSNSQKLHYLISNVSGTAAELIKTFQITDANYAAAWSILDQRYNHRRFIIDSHLNVLFNLPQLFTESASDLRQMRDKVVETIRSLTALGQPTEHWDTLIVHLLVSRFDKETHRQWQLSLTRDQFPTFTELTEFIDNRWQCLEMIPSTPKEINRKVSLTRKPTYTHYSQHINPQCPFCNKDHYINQCDQFSSLNYPDKTQFIKTNKLCFNCLKKGHSSLRCNSKFACRKCNRRHHTLLHNNQIQSTSQSNISSSQPLETSTNISHQSSISSYIVSRNSGQILLSTALVLIKTQSGNHLARALIDPGSQASFISKALVRTLGLKEFHTITQIQGVGKSIASNSTSLVELILCSRISDFTINMQALTMDRITSSLPTSSFNASSYKHLQNIRLADPGFNSIGEIDILIGADVYGTILLNGVIKGPLGSPVAQNTHLGYIISGRVNNKPLESTLINCHITTDDLDKSLKKFWEIEELSAIRSLTSEEIQCETLFNTTYTQNDSGHFVVQLPFKMTNDSLGESRDAAVIRLKQMERRFIRQPNLRLQYIEFMNEYLTLEHMEIIPPTELQKPPGMTYYVPHHAVFKEDSSTTKMRVVFDGSMKTSTGISLNDKLLVGPTVQHDLISILLRWRKHRIGFVADIEKMYRQILVEPSHCDFQRIVWRKSIDEPIMDYRLLTVTYGTSSAPFLAIRALRQLAENNKDRYPLAAEIVLRDFYVDDLISGANDIKTAIETYSQLSKLLQLGGFVLRKWSSNDERLLQQIPNVHHARALQMPIGLDETIKTLGVHWCPLIDSFGYKYQSPATLNIKITKRMLLSDVARLFDPLGWLAPIIIRAKIMLQELWLSGIAWDNNLPLRINQSWSEFKLQLPTIKRIKIPRWIGYSGENQQVELHGFSDASNSAYAAVVYVRIVQSNGIKINLMAAKTKVAPIKTVSLPRLELCGALLLARLLHKVNKAMEFSNIPVTAWTDSSIVQKSPHNWKTFVANRVTEIQGLTNPNQWHYVSTTDNPADCASRGILPHDLADHPLWWTGPSWLKMPQFNWPKYAVNPDTSLDSRQLSSMVLQTISNTPPLNILNRYSSFEKLIRITAYCIRFISNAKLDNSNRLKSHLTAMETRSALNTLIKFVQNMEFKDEVSRCRTGDQVLRKSRLITLNPIIDEKGILRVGGRLANADIPFTQRHPIILPKNNNFTRLLIKHSHTITLHGGPQLMMGYITQTYYVLGLRDLVRSVVHKCNVCFRYRSTAQQQLMGNLPRPRVNPSRAFLHSGIDYAGPIAIRISHGRGCKTVKGYIALFICLVTKAIHLEAVSDLTSLGFIAAYRRFISRRGKCSDLYSDCGTNFVGANTELKLLYRKASAEHTQVADLLSKDGTTWHFIPPASPHFGGLWEAGVKSTKTHLQKILGNTTLTYEEMATLLTQIEACLNSRPLCPISNDSGDLNVLTPGHFLVGEPLITYPEPSLLENNINYLTRWRQIQFRLQHFWKIWSAEYLTRLQQRPKWLQKRNNLQVDQVVLIKDERTPPSKWLLGRITQTHPGKDGLTRVVTVLRNGSEGKLPITKICALPDPDTYEDNTNIGI